MESAVTHKEYIVLFQRGYKEYAPAVFTDGTLVVYGNLSEAIEDAGTEGVVAELVIPKSE